MNCGEHLNEYGSCSDCEFCDDCGEHKEDCSCGEFGSAQRPPWERRGIKVEAVTEKMNWQLVWPEIDTTIDPVQAAADFYLLEAITAGVVVPMPGKQFKAARHNKQVDERFFELYDITDPSDQEAILAARDKQLEEKRETNPQFRLEWAMGEAEQHLERFVERLDATMVAYSHMAIAGELRHHVAVRDRLSTERSSAWCGWPRILEAVGNQALLDAAKLFYEFGGGGYGGPPWANACEVLHARLEGTLGPDGPEGKINKRMFIDRIWTLEHNGGCFLNKIPWSILNGKQWHVGSMRSVLDAHAAMPTNFQRLLKVASPEVRYVFDSHINHVESVHDFHGVAISDNPMLRPSQRFKVCSCCYADATIGHYESCSAVKDPETYGFDGTLPDHNNDWVWVVDEDELDDWLSGRSMILFKESQTKKLTYNTKGEIALDADDVVNMCLFLRFFHKDLPSGLSTSEKWVEITVGELMSNDLKFNLKKFGPKGFEKDFEIMTIKLDVYDKDKNFKLFSFSESSLDDGSQDSVANAKKMHAQTLSVKEIMANEGFNINLDQAEPVSA
jgi:hypothetical protein